MSNGGSIPTLLWYLIVIVIVIVIVVVLLKLVFAVLPVAPFAFAPVAAVDQAIAAAYGLHLS